MTESDWTCLEAADCVAHVSGELFAREAAEYWLGRDAIIGNVLKACQACRSNRRVHKKCRGWVLSFRGATALRLRPRPIAGHEFRVRLEGHFDVQRVPDQRWQAWHLAPMAASSAAIVVESAEGDLLARTHLDLANPDQDGPTWHIQAGGLATAHEKSPLEWLDQPRWPCAPMDFMLFVEFALYSFNWDVWNGLRSTNPWRRFVQKSEALVLDHYVERLNTYWNQRASQLSWLSEQCNRVGRFDPRPA